MSHNFKPVSSGDVSFGSSRPPGGWVFGADGYSAWFYTNVHGRYFRSTNPSVRLSSGSLWRPPSRYVHLNRKYFDVAASHSNNWGSRLIGGDQAGMDLCCVHPGVTRIDGFYIDTNNQYKAETQALLKLTNAKASVGVSLAESKRTFSMLASTAITAFKAYKLAKRGRWLELERLLRLNGEFKVLSGKYPANKWLEYQYGWKPLFSDMYNAYKLTQDSMEGKTFLLHSKSGSVQESISEYTWYDSAARLNYDSYHKTKILCVTHLTAAIDSPSWRQASQLGMINPLSVAWEVVPFSFVLDWFMPIGNMLEALTARAGLTFVGGCNSHVCSSYSRVKTSENQAYELLVPGLLKSEFFHHYRDPLGQWPTPGIYFNDSPFSTTRTLNALALFRSLN